MKNHPGEIGGPDVPGGRGGGAMGARAVERRRVVASSTSRPPRRPGVVDRPLLVDRLVSHDGVPVVLVSAPAGFGKTTVLALWAERDRRPFAWLSLDVAANDPVALVSRLLAALTRIFDLGAEIAEELRAPEPALEDVVLPALVDACAERDQCFVLVLDDVHLVTDRRSQAVITYLGERLPAGCQLALGTRTDPALPLASWRAHGRMIELRAGELSLRVDEAAALLEAAGVELAEHRVAQLVERTEGWPAAVYLAALSLRDRLAPDDFVDRFTGTSRHVADFLSEDVLGRQPGDVIEFLLRTCVLDELTASLCDAVSDGGDSHRLLRELEHSNLFVVPLDDDRQAYRYHHLFRQYLRAELARRQPSMVPELHRRAWRWYRDHGLVGSAVAHAQACGDVAVASELVAREWPAMLDSGRIETLRGWIAGFDDVDIERHAPLAIAAAWVVGQSGDGARALRYVDAARRGTWEGPMPDGSASFDSAVAMMSSVFGIDGVSGMCTAAQRALDVEPPATWSHALASLLDGVGRTLAGEFDHARVDLDEVVRLNPDTASAAFALAHLALVDLHGGDEDAAWRHAGRVHAIVERPGMRNYMPNIGPYAVIAHVASRRGDLDRTAAAVERANVLLPRLTDAFWWLMILTGILLAPALVALGRDAEAANRLDEAAALLATHPDAGLLPDWYQDAARRLRHRRRRPPPAPTLTDAEGRILRLLASDLSLREIGRELYLSPNTVKTHVNSIYRKLGVSSRGAAVTATRGDVGRGDPDSPG